MINQTGGILILNKSKGITSHDAVNRIRRLYGTKQVGHTGTLDPMATGVLVMLVGRAVKCAEFFDGSGGIVDSGKSYRALLRLGIATYTGDITGVVTEKCDTLPGESEVIAAVNSFKGDIMQVPPMYSALKRGGVKLADLARRGITVVREPRPVTIHEITARRINDSDYELDVSCSKGTYIRVLCEDIGRMLGCHGTMAALERTSAHGFSISDSVTLDTLEELDSAGREALLKPVNVIFEGLPKLTLPPFFARLARSGCEIYLHKIGVTLEAGDYATLWDANGMFAVGCVGIYNNKLAIKPVKQFT
jgi:tRNA pseudouridine55 synthase